MLTLNNMILSLYVALFALGRYPTTNFEVKALPASSQVAKTMVVETVKQPEKSYFATVTAYTAVETCKTSCTMASGKPAYIGAAACPRSIPLGTVIKIDGIGEVTCEDRTAVRVDGRFDVFFGYTQADHTRAINWGRPTKKVTILNNK